MTSRQTPRIEWRSDPWLHAVIDDFLPPTVLAELLSHLPRAGKSTKRLPETTAKYLVGQHRWIRETFGFTGGALDRVEIAWTGATGAAVEPHEDRPDKLWGGQLYLAGEPAGTVLYRPDGSQVLLDWQVNRLTAWCPPRNGLKHHAKPSGGRWALHWWILER